MRCNKYVSKRALNMKKRGENRENATKRHF